MTTAGPTAPQVLQICTLRQIAEEACLGVDREANSRNQGQGFDLNPHFPSARGYS